MNDDEACNPQNFNLYTLPEESTDETRMSEDTSGEREEQ